MSEIIQTKPLEDSRSEERIFPLGANQSIFHPKLSLLTKGSLGSNNLGRCHICKYTNESLTDLKNEHRNVSK